MSKLAKSNPASSINLLYIVYNMYECYLYILLMH